MVELELLFSSRGPENYLRRRHQLRDLLIAATAEWHGVTVLHYDHDYGLIASMTEQAVQRVVPRGTAERLPGSEC